MAMNAAHEIVNRDAEIPDGDYYVTVRDAGRTGFLLGPYTDYLAALGDVRRGADLAVQHNSRATFYAYGVSRCAQNGSPRPRTVFTMEGEVAAKAA